MVVPQHVLNWLYSVLTSEYHDVNQTYNDVAQALSHHPSLSPRTDVYTFDDGVSALLVHISGTIPVTFRGTTYRFPISLWIPHTYPREAPIAYVTPTESMVVRPGQHVDPQGRIYHPYLVGWAEFWDKSSILDFLAILRDIFAKEPPVIARQPPKPPPQIVAGTPLSRPPVPPLPNELTRTPVSQLSEIDGRPPPPPPKGSDLPQVVSGQGMNSPTGASLPSNSHQSEIGYGVATPQGRQPSTNRTSRYDSAPPLPQPEPHGMTAQHRDTDHASYEQPLPQAPEYQPLQQQAPYAEVRAGHEHDIRTSSVVSPPTPSYVLPSRSSYIGPPTPWQQQPHQQSPPQPRPKPPPPPDIMDEPLTLTLHLPSQLSPPPIPPNPEKDALLCQLGSTLHSIRLRAREQNEFSLAGLNAQRNAMLNALQNIQQDSSTLGPLSAMLSSNTAILQQSLREADAVIANSRKQAPPDIDELLVAPTMVGNQLYDVVAEERALGDAIFVLGRAMERGRITPAVFAKTTRSLAREWYLKKALVQKIGAGMGLVG